MTVLIADVAGFAELTPALSPERLALLLDEIFTRFDGVACAFPDFAVRVLLIDGAPGAP